MKQQTIFTPVIFIIFIFALICAVVFMLPKIPSRYIDADLGISFELLGKIEKIEPGHFTVATNENETDLAGRIYVVKLFGYSPQKTSEHIVELLKLDPVPVSQKVIIDHKTAVLVTEPYDKNRKTIYVLVDDALFVITLEGVDPEKFYKSLVFTKVPVMSYFSTIKIDEQKKRFVNYKAGYEIDVPSNFGFVATDNGVYFGLPFEGPGPSISIYTATSTNDSKLKFVMDSNQGTFEKKIKIDGTVATVMHAGNLKSNGEEFPYYKDTFFSKGSYFYNINTQYVDHEKVWNSFKFLQ